MARFASALFALVALSATSCYVYNEPVRERVPSSAELDDYQLAFMSSYYAERGGSPAGARALTPFPAPAGTGARATVPVYPSSRRFADLVGKTTAIAGEYPEPGQSTSFTVAEDSARPGPNGTKVYAITATTSYPASDLRKTYVEKYYVDDITVGDAFGGGTSDGTWNQHDFIVAYRGGAWEADLSARESMVLVFRDGTTRTESIVSSSLAGGPKFDVAAFDIDGSLDLGAAFIPGTAPSADPDVMFSSVVLYRVTPSRSYDFWFWKGRSEQSILGVRYYTEKATGSAGTGTYTAYTASFEKTLATLTTTGGDYSTTMQEVFVGSTFDALAQSVLRQRVEYGLAGSAGAWTASGSGSASTRMMSRVVNIAGRKDFFLSQLDSDAVTLASWAGSTIYVPTGSEEEVLAGDPAAFVYERRAAATLSGGQSLASETVSSGLGSLATVYASIQSGAAAKAAAGAPASNVSPGGQSWDFNGANVVGNQIDPTKVPALTTSGTVEAWVYLDKMTDTMGIVHKGVKTDFTDEAWSLQGWSNSGQIAMMIDRNGSYDAVYSSTKIGTKKWYYLVGTWDLANGNRYLRLYINGVSNGSATPSKTYPLGTTDSQTLGMMVGSQLPASYSAAYGYFGVDGRIVGVNVSTAPMSAAEVLAKYNQYKDAAAGW